MAAPIMGLVDGPTEVHRNTVARQVLKGYQPVDGLWPSQHLPARMAQARAKYADHPEALARRRVVTRPNLGRWSTCERRGRSEEL